LAKAVVHKGPAATRSPFPASAVGLRSPCCRSRIAPTTPNRRSSPSIRVTAQLIDAQSGENVWNQTYDRKVAGVSELQDEISATIAASLVGDLTRAEAGRAQQRGTRNLEAWSLYELGLQHIFRLTPKDMAEARALFDQAVALEPKFATAHALLSITYSWEVQLGSGGSPQDNWLSRWKRPVARWSCIRVIL
jgi:hypothetical protein